MRALDGRGDGTKVKVHVAAQIGGVHIDGGGGIVLGVHVVDGRARRRSSALQSLSCPSTHFSLASTVTTSVFAKKLHMIIRFLVAKHKKAEKALKANLSQENRVLRHDFRDFSNALL